MSEKRCPNCGRRMKQQFIGLRHCKCGISWKKHQGYFIRTPDMVFALERRWVGNKRKQVSVIRYKTEIPGNSAKPTQGRFSYLSRLFNFLKGGFAQRTFRIREVLRRTSKFILYAKIPVLSPAACFP